MTAEFAVVLPVVVAVLGLVLGAVTLSAQRISLVASSAEVARFEARGDDAQARARLAQLSANIEVTRFPSGPLQCVRLGVAPLGGMLASLKVSSESCAMPTGDMP